MWRSRNTILTLKFHLSALSLSFSLAQRKIYNALARGFALIRSVGRSIDQMDKRTNGRAGLSFIGIRLVKLLSFKSETMRVKRANSLYANSMIGSPLFDGRARQTAAPLTTTIYSMIFFRASLS